MKSVHLLVGVNGMWGNPSHLSHLAQVISSKYPELDSSDSELEILIAQTNRDTSTYDGIDWGGERVADEVEKRVNQIEESGERKVRKFSAVGYSLGGLVARYLVGILAARKFFDNIVPVNFTTFATPHIGIPRYPSFISSVAATLGPRLLSRTGEQFFGQDQWSDTGRPLLEVMADKNRLFYQTLARFEKLTFYANAVNDVTVPYVTGAIEAEDPFMKHETNGIQIEIDFQYSPLIKSFTVADSPPPKPPKPPVFSKAYLKSLKPKPILLPPALQFKFPFNVILYISLPLLIPIVIATVLVRFTIDSRASRARIKLLESNQSSATSLVSLLRNLEKEMDDAVADIIDDTGSDEPIVPSEGRSNLLTNNTTVMEEQPQLTPLQLSMIKSLNALPKLVKRLAFIHPVRNSHATLICRDIKRFPIHKLGEGVLRHWADNFQP